MFIVPSPKQNGLKPHRGGMMGSGDGHTAPTELERIIGGTVTINLSLPMNHGVIGSVSLCVPIGSLAQVTSPQVCSVLLRSWGGARLRWI
jgi:hypothetical protein